MNFRLMTRTMCGVLKNQIVLRRSAVGLEM